MNAYTIKGSLAKQSCCTARLVGLVTVDWGRSTSRSFEFKGSLDSWWPKNTYLIDHSQYQPHRCLLDTKDTRHKAMIRWSSGHNYGWRWSLQGGRALGTGLWPWMDTNGKLTQFFDYVTERGSWNSAVLHSTFCHFREPDHTWRTGQKDIAQLTSRYCGFEWFGFPLRVIWKALYYKQNNHWSQ